MSEIFPVYLSFSGSVVLKIIPLDFCIFVHLFYLQFMEIAERDPIAQVSYDITSEDLYYIKTTVKVCRGFFSPGFNFIVRPCISGEILASIAIFSKY
jgi:hypothetical protein